MANINELNLLKERVKKLEEIVAFYVRSDRYYFQRDLELAEGVNFRLGSRVGNTFGDSNSKIGFFDAAPIGKQAGFSELTVTGSAQDATCRASVNVVRTVLVNLGLMNPTA
jgi:hypothetical protein